MEQRYIAGDWVKHRGKLARVEETYRTNYSVKECHDDYNPDIEYDDAYFFREVRPQNLVPIPLTFEILERNGWKLREHHEDKHFYDIEWYLYNNPSITNISLRFYPEKKAFFPFLYKEEIFEKPIQYVHQLQHLLFGLGIDFDFNLENNYENNKV